MSKLKFAASFLIAAFILTDCLPKGVVKLPIVALHQSTSYTCWASSLAIIASYVKKITLSDCEVVSHVNNEISLTSDCCTEKSEDCLRGGDYTDFMVAMEYVFKINYRFVSTPLAWGEIKEAIDAGNPIIAVRYYPTNSGHANVIVGYDERTKGVVIIEPTFGEEVTEPYDKFVGNLWSGVWTGSFIVTSKPTEKPTCHWNCTPGVGCKFLKCSWNEGEKAPLATREH